MKHEEQPYLWRFPKKLPPCWWVAVKYQGNRLCLRWPSDDEKEAKENCRLEREQAKEWLERPVRIEVMREDPELRCERSAFAMTILSAPADLLSATIGGDFDAPIVRCRFARGSDLNLCASWIKKTILRFLPARNLQIRMGIFEPIIETYLPST